MSKIPYRFRTPIPLIFWKNGILDPAKKIYKNRLAFLTWAFSRCYYDSYEFSCSREEASKESGLTEDEWRTQEEFFVGIEILEKLSGAVRKKGNHYRWVVEKLEEYKIIELEKTPNKNTTVLREENQKEEKKNPQEKKEIPNKIPNKIPAVLRVENEKNPQEIPNKTPTSLEQEEQKNLCLKETNINKEKSNLIPTAGKNLSLSLEEKKLFSASRENELQQHQVALEAYVSYRNIDRITSKTIARWISTYPIDDIEAAIGLMLEPGKKKVVNPGGWIENTLQKGIVRQERIKKQNMQFAQEIQSKNKYLKITSRYCQDVRHRDKEFYYHMDPQIFESELRKCL